MILDTIDKDCNLHHVPRLILATKSNCVRLAKDIFEKEKTKNKIRISKEKNGGSSYVPSRKNGSSCKRLNYYQ